MITIKPIENKIPIITASNNDFAIMAAAFLKSVEINCRNPQNYIIYLLSDGISKRNISKIRNSTGLSVHFIPITKDILNGIELPDKVDYLPKTAYFRLMIPEIFQRFNKIIYLDIDTLILGDLEELWQINLEDKLALACKCFYAPNHHGLDYFDIVGIERESPYFNSGMLVMDIAMWRKEKIRDQVNKLLNKTLNKPKVMDEEGLNIVLHGKWKIVDQKWNSPPQIAHNDYMPVVLHYIGNKPIYKDYKGKFQELFFQYLNQTAWAGTSSYGFLKKMAIKSPQKLKMIFKGFLES